MTVEIGGAGTLGIAFESTVGTFIAPTKWIPIRSESMQVVEDKIYRMNLRGLADRSGAIQGYTHTEGDIVFEVTPDILVYFLYCARTTPAKAAQVYTFIPAHVAKVSTAASGVTLRRTMSMLIARSARPFGYVGNAVSQLAFTIDGGVLVCTASMYGTDEAAQTAGTPSYAAQVVSGPGKLTLEYPTATTRADVDTFNFTINDNAVTANRLNGNRFAAYENWGEREVTAHFEADFDPLTDYTAFRNQTISPIKFSALPVPGTEEFVIVFNATAIDAAPINLAGLGDVNRANIDLHAFYNTSDAYTITLKTAEVIT
jgi:hypothetical protein